MRTCVGVLVILSCLVAVAVFAQSSANYTLTGGNLNAGGSAAMSSANYSASVTLGQSSPIGVSNSASYQAQMGVQYLYQSQNSPSSAYNYLLWTK